MKNRYVLATIVAAFTDSSCKTYLFDVREKLIPGMVEKMAMLFQVGEDGIEVSARKELTYEFMVLTFHSELTREEIKALLTRINLIYAYVYFIME